MMKLNSGLARSTFFEELSVIELLMVVLIIGLIWFLILPYMTKAIHRTYASEGIGLASDLRSQTALYYAHHGQLPQKNQQLTKFKADGKYIQNIRLQQGIVITELKPKVLDLITLNLDKPAQLTLQATLSNTSTMPFIAWRCGMNTVHDSIITTLPSDYLPHICRSTP